MKFGLRHIRYFLAVAEDLNFRRASEKLNISQPALSRAIQHLEADLGVQLFARSQSFVRLTEAGVVFRDGARAVLNGMEATVDLTRRINRGEAGALRVGYTDFAIAGALPELLKQFRLGQPGITIRPHHGVTSTQLRELDDDKLDIGFVTGPVRQAGLGRRAIQTDRPICIVHESHRFAQRKSLRLKDLADEDFVHGPAKDWAHFYDYLFPLCRRAGFMPRIVQEAFNSVGILGLVSCGMGITILTETIYNFASGGLVALPLEDVPEVMLTEAVWNSDKARLPTLQFVEFLDQQIALGQIGALPLARS
ncbi:HTH-type transcriptional regulator BenM [Roseovarius litorisediminis]|uniref:HTH-type transcriptional regulator BenM n=1 Tax=Roseovarius litorisediminis TaxID=1312363 RepID=A0A1Y5RQX8_9RHOB|nr:LysR family transcriptional regulator [Roseovarius litorisediminis]SLN23265.1 HTH-type transcriptional regulator BenM [Roseovarius litorisediminis]